MSKILSYNYARQVNFFRTWSQQGQQQELQAKGLVKWITSRSFPSLIFKSKGRSEPQQLRVQQSVSSFALKITCPWLFLILYLLFVSHPKKARINPKLKIRKQFIFQLSMNKNTFQKFHFLFDIQRVNLGQVFQTWWHIHGNAMSVS